MMFRTELRADQRLDPPRDVALPCRRAIGAEQVFAQLPRGRRAPLALAADDIFRHALANDGARRFSGLGAIAVERFFQIGSQSERFGHGLYLVIQIVKVYHDNEDSVKHLLLVGGGHSHLAVLKSFGDAPAEGVQLSLLSPRRYAFYSGMVPGVVAGHYRPEDCRIDLLSLAARADARFFQDSAVGMDPARREVITARGERLAYDFLSLDIGSATREPAGTGEQPIRVRPVEAFLAGWERLRESARRGEVRRIAVVGGGAAGVEVLLAMRHALAGVAVDFALFSELPVLAGHGARGAMVRVLGARGVEVHSGRKVVAVGEDKIELEGGERFEAQAAVWATGASAPSWIAQSGLATDSLGFVEVSDTLQSRSHPGVFAAGDVASVVGEARPKSGVFAVRQGPVLARNLRRALAGEAAEPFRPPSRSLALISCGDKYAVASWGGLAVQGAWVWRWKDRIDRRFVERYRL